jgi:hypothetical protein
MCPISCRLNHCAPTCMTVWTVATGSGDFNPGPPLAGNSATNATLFSSSGSAPGRDTSSAPGHGGTATFGAGGAPGGNLRGSITSTSASTLSDEFSVAWTGRRTGSPPSQGTSRHGPVPRPLVAGAVQRDSAPGDHDVIMGTVRAAQAHLAPPWERPGVNSQSLRLAQHDADGDSGSGSDEEVAARGAARSLGMPQAYMAPDVGAPPHSSIAAGSPAPGCRRLSPLHKLRPGDYRSESPGPPCVGPSRTSPLVQASHCQASVGRQTPGIPDPGPHTPSRTMVRSSGCHKSTC